MKVRHALPLLVASALITSCGKDRNTDTLETVPIEFSTGMSAVTKGIKPDNPAVLLTEGNKVSVFGTRIYNDEPETVFSNRPLTCNAVPNPSTPSNPLSSVWTYTPVKYWKDNGDYFFSAVFPYSNENVTIDNTYVLRVNYFAGENYDMMVARSFQDSAESKDPVELRFKHTTSAVRFLFGKSSSSDSDQYVLTSFQLENFVASGEFSMATRVTGEPSINAGDWSVSSSYGTLFSWTAETPADRIPIIHPSSAGNPDGYTPMGWYYMVPQTLSTQASVRFSISYNNGTPVETVLNIYGATDQTDGIGTAWLPNCVYNYFITVNQSGLNLTVRRTLWDEVTVTTDDFNFE